MAIIRKKKKVEPAMNNTEDGNGTGDAFQDPRIGSQSLSTDDASREEATENRGRNFEAIYTNEFETARKDHVRHQRPGWIRHSDTETQREIVGVAVGVIIL